jgi:predicted GNAT family acetyltransferase/ppGpp synthetase/RelA/SpoT-type nucleotidyltranferase
MNRDEIDIFEYNLGGSVSEMMRNPKLERDPLMTEEQAAYFASQLLPGAATLDATGNMPGMPSSDADLIDIFGAENNPSFLENVRQGKILDPALQALGVLGDATYAIPALGATLGTALKAPGALRKAMKISRATEDASDIFGKGSKRVRLTDQDSGGTIEVLNRSDGSASVLELYVPDTARGQGIGEALQKKVLEEFPNMGGQVSSKAAAKTAYRLGRRPVGNPDASLEDVFDAIDEMSSVNLISPARQALTGGIDNLPQNIARAPDGIESVDAARSIAAIERGTLVDGPIRTTPIFQEFGIDRVREVEAALKRQQGDLLSVEDMVSRANTVNPSFQANIDSVAKSVGGKKADKFINLKDGSQFDVEVKTPKSIATKVERKGLKLADFTDGVRTTIYIDTADQAEEAVNQIGQMYTTIDRGWQRIPESGYFDRKMNVLVGDPATGKKIVAEIQIKTPEMFDAGEQGAHRWYDYSRKLEGRYNHEIPGTKLKLYNKALAEQRRLFGAAFDAADPAILEQLVDKFMQGGAVVAGPQSFRISFQNWA